MQELVIHLMNQGAGRMCALPEHEGMDVYQTDPPELFACQVNQRVEEKIEESF